MTDNLTDLRNRFVWTKDKLEGWRVLSSLTGPLKGDCDDFAMTALWIMAGKSWLRVWWLILTCQAAVWYCHSERGNGHAVLWLRGHGWIDNIYPHWATTTRHTRRFPWPAPIVVVKLLLGMVRD